MGSRAHQARGINHVYVIGGDGTQRGANAIYLEARARGLKLVVAGIPKTIDNDVAIIDRSFGFDTAVEEAQRAIAAAHVEAESTPNGIGFVKVRTPKRSQGGSKIGCWRVCRVGGPILSRPVRWRRAAAGNRSLSPTLRARRRHHSPPSPGGYECITLTAGCHEAVQVMGRHAGWIAMHASLASRDVDVCLIPESNFFLEGAGGIFEFVGQRLRQNGHCVVVVAEGAGQEMMVRPACPPPSAPPAAPWGDSSSIMELWRSSP